MKREANLKKIKNKKFQVERSKKFPNSGLRAPANSLFCSQRSAHKSFTELEGKDLDAELEGGYGGLCD